MKRLQAYALIFVLAAGALAQQAAPAPADRASLDRIRADIEYLASDPLEGRRTGSPGANLAAEHISREFKEIGLQPIPGASGGAAAKLTNGFGQEFPYIADVVLGKPNTLSAALGSKPASELMVGHDWMPLGFSANARLENAAAVFVKHGITAKELNHDDYAGLDVTGKIAIALEGTPDGDNPHGQFANYEGARWKAIAAKDHGAAALILLSDAPAFTDESYAQLHYDNAGEAGLPVLVLANQAWTGMLAATGQVPALHCDPAVTQPDGSIVTPCGDLKMIKLPGGGYLSEDKDGKRSPMGPGGLQRINQLAHMDELAKFKLNLNVAVERRNAPAYNIVGELPGVDPQLKNEVVVIGAHYDHLGRGGEGSLAPRSGDIHHGADDNASGIAGLLELARTFAAHRSELRRTIVFIAFSGEEEGLIGSNYYVNHPLVPLAQTAAMVNMDMIGRLREGKLTVGGIGTSADFNSLVTSNNIVKELVRKGQGGAPDEYMAHNSFNLSLSEDGFGPSDHSSFYAKQVPVLFFFTGTHDDYHKPTDTADKINYDGELGVIRFVQAIALELDQEQTRPAYAVAKSSSPGGRSTGFRVYLGTIPNYGDTNDGLLLDGVRDGSPAATAGLKAGDKVVKIAGRDIKNVYDYTYALGEMKAGETYEVEVMRGTERLHLQIVPAARKQ